MKRALLVLTMLLMAATSYNQASRRTVNANSPATRSTESRTTTTTTTTTRTSTNDSQTAKQGKTGTHSSTVSNQRTNTSNSRTHSTNQNYSNNGNSNQYRKNGNMVDNHANNNGHDNKKYSDYNHKGNDYHGQTRTSHGGNVVYINSSRRYQDNHQPVHTYSRTPYSRDYRAKHYAYRQPVHTDIVWTREMHRLYLNIYPEVHYWNYSIGYRINSVSSYYADYYIGDVMNVYGQVADIYYTRETDEYFLYFGAYYPFQDFTVVLPGDIARIYSHRPELYFMNQYVNVTGLITAFNNEPEIVVKRNIQINVY